MPMCSLKIVCSFDQGADNVSAPPDRQVGHGRLRGDGHRWRTKRTGRSRTTGVVHGAAKFRRPTNGGEDETWSVLLNFVTCG